MEARATAKYLRSTARKARLVADSVRGQKVGDALTLLEHGSSTKASEDVAKVLKSAVANLQNKNVDANVSVDDLRIKEIRVDEGPTLKRFRPRAQGRAYQILKHMCHVSVTVCS